MDQRELWDKVYEAKKSKVNLGEPSSFAQEIIDLIPSGSRLLELGCGQANDSLFFASNGLEVIATDFSEVVISKNKKDFKEITNLCFVIQDISKPLNFTDQEFDVIYAHLSLHYFTHEVTEQIFQELYRVLSQDGLLCFVCKSTADSNYGLGKELEKDMFDKDGHIRHFFTNDYAKELLDHKYKEKVWLVEEEFDGKTSSFVKVIAQKT